MLALEETAAALRAEDWPRALDAAISAWRITRSTALADLIDRITARCTLPKAPHTKAATHRWWMANAVAPDALMIGALLEAFRDRLHAESDVTWEVVRGRWPEPNPIIEGIAREPPPTWWANYAAANNLSWPPRIQNWVDRVAAMMRWPDDPRVTRSLVAVLADPDCTAFGGANERVARAIADRLIALRDHRAGALLAKIVAAKGFATFKQRITNPLVPEITAAIPVPDPVELTRTKTCVALMPERVSPEIDVGPLWREVAEHPDEDAPRLVLADALIAAGDSRGELIALQFVDDPAKRGHAQTQAHRLINREWHRWMGPLALILAHKGTTFRNGLLETIRVGLTSTPSWAWEEVQGHRELACVREVRPAHVHPHDFAKLVAGLDRFPRMIAIDAHEVVQELAKSTSKTALEEVYYSPVSAQVYYRRTRPSFEEVIAMLGAIAPDLQRIDLGPLWWVSGEFYPQLTDPERFVAMLQYLPPTFRRLQRVRVDSRSVVDDARARVRALPYVELVAPKTGP